MGQTANFKVGDVVHVDPAALFGRGPYLDRVERDGWETYVAAVDANTITIDVRPRKE